MGASVSERKTTPKKEMSVLSSFYQTYLEVTSNSLFGAKNPRHHLTTLNKDRSDQVASLLLVRKLTDKMHQVGHVAQNHLHQRGRSALGHLVSTGRRRLSVGQVVRENERSELERGQEELVEDIRGFDRVGKRLLRFGVGRVSVRVSSRSEGEEESSEGSKGSGLVSSKTSTLEEEEQEKK